MNKEKKLVSICILIAFIGGISYLQFIRPMINGKRVESGDVFVVFTSMVSGTMEQFEKIPGYDKLSDIQVRKFKDKMGGCLFTSLMRMPLNKDFDYMTLKEKAEYVEKALTTTYNKQFGEDIEECYKKLDQDILRTFPINWGKQ